STYDILDRVLSVSREVDPATNVVTAYTYDSNQNRALTRFGQATSGADPFNLIHTIYDERDLVFREIRGEGSPTQSTTQHDYDLNGNEIAVTQGTESSPRITGYAYDGYNRRLTAIDPMGNVTAFHYDANANLTT